MKFAKLVVAVCVCAFSFFEAANAQTLTLTVGELPGVGVYAEWSGSLLAPPAAIPVFPPDAGYLDTLLAGSAAFSGPVSYWQITGGLTFNSPPAMTDMSGVLAEGEFCGQALIILPLSTTQVFLATTIAITPGAMIEGCLLIAGQSFASLGIADGVSWTASWDGGLFGTQSFVFNTDVTAFPPGSPTCFNTFASCGGDPHFKTWGGDRFNYHGECDLVLIHNESFQDGTGLDVHVRTKIEDIYSIISAVAIKVGETIFELDHEIVGEPKFYANGLELPELPYNDDKHVSITRHGIHSEEYNENIDVITMDLGRNSVIQVEIMNKWVMLNVNSPGYHAAGSTGLAGSYPAGIMLGRDGVMDFKDDRNSYGSQWQVQEDEPQLFHSTPEGHPQAPHATCKLPTLNAELFLRTKNSELYHVAMDVCMKEGVTGLDLEDCVFDVVMMENVKVAAVWGEVQK